MRSIVHCLVVYFRCYLLLCVALRVVLWLFNSTCCAVFAVLFCFSCVVGIALYILSCVVLCCVPLCVVMCCLLCHMGQVMWIV